jgi:phosphoribosylformimino-5-aminoimidazole carboxamide ribotide isomerase
VGSESSSWILYLFVMRYAPDMVLIIPSIPIVHGLCGAQIALLAHEARHAELEIYSQSPVDRARLLRKENAKMIHLEFLDRDPWDDECLCLIHEIREAVDVPVGFSLADSPHTESECTLLFDAGIHRIFLPREMDELQFLHYCGLFTSRKIIPKVNPSFDFETKFSEYRTRGVERIGVEISGSDALEMGTLDWDRLEAMTFAARTAGIRLTAFHGVRGYPDLKHLQELGPALDSLILCRALNENRFPCQLIWREVEAVAALEENPASNLWSNPLEGKPHI